MTMKHRHWKSLAWWSVIKLSFTDEKTKVKYVTVFRSHSKLVTAIRASGWLQALFKVPRSLACSQVLHLSKNNAGGH